MQCFVYRSSKRLQTYVYMAKKEDFEILPPDLVVRLGQLEFSLEIDLVPERKLALEDPKAVLRNLRAQGWHLQLPRDEKSLLVAPS